jgi:hypothetical protein
LQNTIADPGRWWPRIRISAGTRSVRSTSYTTWVIRAAMSSAATTTCSASRWYVELSSRTASGNVAENSKV